MLTVLWISLRTLGFIVTASVGLFLLYALVVVGDSLIRRARAFLRSRG